MKLDLGDRVNSESWVATFRMRLYETHAEVAYSVFTDPRIYGIFADLTRSAYTRWLATKRSLEKDL